MSFPAGVLECMARIEPDPSKNMFGSGLLIGREFVLTCAHVIDENYQTCDLDSRFARRPEDNQSLLQRFTGRRVTVTAFDDIPREAVLHRIDDSEDMVVLRLLTPLEWSVTLPPFAPALIPNLEAEFTGYGFRKIDAMFTLKARSYEPIAFDTVAMGGESQAFSGNTSPGMSGGAVFMARGGCWYIFGMCTMGGEGMGNSEHARASELKRFLDKALGAAVVATHFREEKDFGLATPSGPVPDKGGLDWTWIRVTPPRAQLPLGTSAVHYLASRPLTLHDIDGLLDREQTETLRAIRACVFATLTNDEAERAADLLAAHLNVRVELPVHSALDAMLAPDRETTGLPPYQAHSRQRPVLPPDRDAALSLPSGFALLPEDTAEWSRDAEGGVIRVLRPSQGHKWRADTSASFIGSTASRALLRPMLSVPLWSSLR